MLRTFRGEEDKTGSQTSAYVLGGEEKEYRREGVQKRPISMSFLARGGRRGGVGHWSGTGTYKAS